eukprot:Em0018g1157a
MQLFVRGQALHAISVSSGTTSSDVKDIISVFEGIPTEEQLLTYAGIPLEDDAVVLNVVPEHGTISVTARIIGGKVHGSLTRAGKVEPQEKKKKKTGRAKRRLAYNRRFVNVVASVGRKRGPNSNS